MQQMIIGILLVIIIVIGGWLIYYYNKMANRKIMVDDSLDQLNFNLQKRNSLLLITDVDASQLEHQLKELEEKFQVCRYIYDNAMTSYNKSITTFPGNASGLILGLTELPYYVKGEQEDGGADGKS